MRPEKESKRRSFAEMIGLPGEPAQQEHRSFAELLDVPRTENLTPGAKTIIAAGEKARGKGGKA